MIVQSVMRKTIVTIIYKDLFRIWFHFNLPNYQEMNFVVIFFLGSKFDVGIMKIHVVKKSQ